MNTVEKRADGITVVTAPGGVRHEISKGDIHLDKIYAAEYQKDGTLTAQIRQLVETKSFYPSKKVENNLQGNIFNTSDFGFGEQEFSSLETRVAWIPVPASIDEATVVAKLVAATTGGATIYKVLSNEPILSDDQKYAITQGLRDYDYFANQQAVRYPENDETKANGTAGKLTLDKNGNVQYRRTYFWNTPLEDVDARDEKKVYLSPELKAEMQGASTMAGQTI